jgi:hypothetical protein
LTSITPSAPHLYTTSHHTSSLARRDTHPFIDYPSAVPTRSARSSISGTTSERLTSITLSSTRNHIPLPDPVVYPIPPLPYPYLQPALSSSAVPQYMPFQYGTYPWSDQQVHHPLDTISPCQDVFIGTSVTTLPSTQATPPYPLPAHTTPESF